METFLHELAWVLFMLLFGAMVMYFLDTLFLYLKIVIIRYFEYRNPEKAEELKQKYLYQHLNLFYE